MLTMMIQVLIPQHQTSFPNTVQSHPLQNPQPTLNSGLSNDINASTSQTNPDVDHSFNAPSNTTTNTSTDRRDSSMPQMHNFSSEGLGGPPQLPLTHVSSNLFPQASTPVSGAPNDSLLVELPPLRPVFGVSLDDLFKRDGSAIPSVVSQCLQAVDLYGLDVEGIYRLSGSAAHITKLRIMFDNGNFKIKIDLPDLQEGH